MRRRKKRRRRGRRRGRRRERGRLESAKCWMKSSQGVDFLFASQNRSHFLLKAYDVLHSLFSLSSSPLLSFLAFLFLLLLQSLFFKEDLTGDVKVFVVKGYVPSSLNGLLHIHSPSPSASSSSSPNPTIDFSQHNFA